MTKGMVKKMALSPVLDDILMHVYPDLPFRPLQQPTACIVAGVENGLRKLPQGMVEPAH